MRLVKRCVGDHAVRVRYREPTLDDIAAIVGGYCTRPADGAQYQLSTSAEALLWLVYLHEDDHTLTMFASALHMSVHAVSRGAAQLVKQGFAAYVPCPTDARKKRLRLTPEGRARVRAGCSELQALCRRHGLVKLLAK